MDEQLESIPNINITELVPKMREGNTKLYWKLRAQQEKMALILKQKKQEQRRLWLELYFLRRHQIVTNGQIRNAQTVRQQLKAMVDKASIFTIEKLHDSFPQTKLSFFLSSSTNSINSLIPMSAIDIQSRKVANRCIHDFDLFPNTEPSHDPLYTQSLIPYCNYSISPLSSLLHIPEFQINEEKECTIISKGVRKSFNIDFNFQQSSTISISYTTELYVPQVIEQNKETEANKKEEIKENKKLIPQDKTNILNQSENESENEAENLIENGNESENEPENLIENGNESENEPESIIESNQHENESQSENENESATENTNQDENNENNENNENESESENENDNDTENTNLDENESDNETVTTVATETTINDYESDNETVTTIATETTMNDYENDKEDETDLSIHKPQIRKVWIPALQFLCPIKYPEHLSPDNKFNQMLQLSDSLSCLEWSSLIGSLGNQLAKDGISSVTDQLRHIVASSSKSNENQDNVLDESIETYENEKRKQEAINNLFVSDEIIESNEGEIEQNNDKNNNEKTKRLFVKSEEGEEEEISFEEESQNQLPKFSNSDFEDDSFAEEEDDYNQNFSFVKKDLVQQIVEQYEQKKLFYDSGEENNHNYIPIIVKETTNANTNTNILKIKLSSLYVQENDNFIPVNIS